MRFLESQPSNATIVLRRGNKSEPGVFEQYIAEVAVSDLWMNVEWMRPDPEHGRGATFLRDLEFVERADVVLCFFDKPEMSGGTQHVVEAAIDKDTPVYAWGFTDDGFIRIGEHDPDDVWASSVPVD